MVNYAGGMATLQQCKDRLIGYLERLGEAKLRDLTCLMFLGRNLDLYGLCREIVVEFESRAGESLAYGADELAERPHLGEWLRLVAEAEE